IDDNPSNLPAGANYLYGVDEVDLNHLWAVGYTLASGGGVNALLPLEWVGASGKWIVDQHDTFGRLSRLYGVECLSTNACWGSGAWLDEIGPIQTLTEKWNGVSWTKVLSPNQGSLNNSLYGVRSINTNWTWVVGEYGGLT